MPQQYGPTPDQNDEYFRLQEETRSKFEDTASQYKNGKLTSDEYRNKMRDEILNFLIDLMILAEGPGYEFTDQDIADAEEYSKDILGLLDQMILFVKDPSQFTENYLRWRAGIFTNARQVFMRYTMPRDVFASLPVMPGDDCLGDGACGCSWEINTLEDGTIEAYWTLGATEHCSVCSSHAATYNPYTISS